MWTILILLVTVLAIICPPAFSANPQLGSYNIGDITVSGLSSGAYMAVQMHVAYSSIITGAAIFAGGPYYCAQGSVSTAQGTCMDTYLGSPNAQTYVNATNKAFTAKNIDDPANLNDDPVYLFSGSADSVVKPVVMKTLDTYYQAFVKKENIVSKYDLKAEHCFPTLNYGEACAVKSSPYIGKCQFDGAEAALRVLFGDLAPSTDAVPSHLTAFDQSPFVPAKASLGDVGYIYVPAACADGNTKCHLHISFHGCVQDLASIKNQYAEDTGFNRWAESNNIIVLYPYAVSSVSPSNPNSCWDWWGYAGTDYAYKSGKQMKFVKDMIDHMKKDVPVVPTASPVTLPPSPTAAPVPAQPSPEPTLRPTSGFKCEEWTACVWDHYNAGRAVFSSNFQHYLAKGSNDDLGSTGYCGGAVGATSPIPVKLTAENYYEKGNC